MQETMKEKLFDKELMEDLRDELMTGYIKTHGKIGVDLTNPLESQPLINYANAMKLAQSERKSKKYLKST